jgi:hypothetical protein
MTRAEMLDRLISLAGDALGEMETVHGRACYVAGALMATSNLLADVATKARELSPEEIEEGAIADRELVGDIDWDDLLMAIRDHDMGGGDGGRRTH